MKRKFLTSLVIAATVGLSETPPVMAETISTLTYQFQSLESLAVNGSGLGNYNVILFAGANGGSGNDDGNTGIVNVDNSNTGLPSGGTSTSQSLFWMTSVADLRAFYNQQFGVGTVNNIVLFLDINETGQSGETVTLTSLNIYKNATTTPTGLNPNAPTDLQSSDQLGISGFTGGSILTQLASSQTLSQYDTGAGIDDWSIFTFIDPFDPSLLPTDTLLFNLAMTGLAAGGEVLSINGALTACDIDPKGCPTPTSGTSTTTSGTSTTTTTTTTTSGDPTGTSTTTTTTSGDPTGSSTTTGNTTTTTSGDPTSGSTTTTIDPTTGVTSTGDPTTGTTSTGDPTSTGTGSTATSTTGVTSASTSGESSGTSREIPEPSSFLLLGAGLVALSRAAKRKKD